jgi:hypothetical protein
VENFFSANPDYKLFDNNFGWTGLSRFMFKKVYEEMVKLANPEKDKENEKK